MHLEKPSLAKFLQDPSFKGYAIFAEDFLPIQLNRARLPAKPLSIDCRNVRGPRSLSPELMLHKLRGWRFGDWETFTGKRFADLAAIRQPTLVVKRNS